MPPFCELHQQYHSKLGGPNAKWGCVSCANAAAAEPQSETLPLPEGCPFCGAFLTLHPGDGDITPDQWQHDAKDCWLESAVIYPEEVSEWNRRAPTPTCYVSVGCRLCDTCATEKGVCAYAPPALESRQGSPSSGTEPDEIRVTCSVLRDVMRYLTNGEEPESASWKLVAIGELASAIRLLESRSLSRGIPDAPSQEAIRQATHALRALVSEAYAAGDRKALGEHLDALCALAGNESALATAGWKAFLAKVSGGSSDAATPAPTDTQRLEGLPRYDWSRDGIAEDANGRYLDRDEVLGVSDV